MIYPLAGLIFGGLIGAYRARARGGKVADILQWGVVHGIIFGLLGLFVLIAIERSLT
jgi:hypothetical protein